MKILILLLMFFSLSVNAHTNEYLYLGAWSKHINDEGYEQNSTHNLIGYNKHGIVAGVFKNTYNDRAYFFGGELKSYQYKDFQFNLYGVVVFGYYECFGGKPDGAQMRKICPTLTPEFVYTKYKLQPTVSILVKAVTVGARYQF
jgi:hypothetical protein